MADTSSPLVTSSEDINRITEIAAANSVTAIRISKDMIERRLPILQRRLSDLRYNEGLIKARFYNDKNLLIIEQKYKADAKVTVKPIQGMAEVEVDITGPHHSVAFDQNSIDRRQVGLIELKKEIEKINNEIKVVESQIRDYTKVLNDIQKRLDFNDGN